MSAIFTHEPTAARAAFLRAVAAARHELNTQSGRISFACLGIASVLWFSSLFQIDPSGLDDLGLYSILPWSFWVALVLLAAGFAVSVRQDMITGLLSASHLVALVFMLHTTPAIAYGTLRYSWAWKHIGIVDFIQRHGQVDPTAPFLAAYHNWPGFFVVSAMFADVFNLTPLELSNLARFAPTVFNLLFLAALVPLLRRFTPDPRVTWTAAWIFVAGNWVGQDYFSPQSTAYFLYLVMLGLCVGPLMARPGWARPGGRDTSGLAWRLWSFLSAGVPEPVSTPRERAISAVVVLGIIFAITASHQLTPLMVISALAGLTVIGRLPLGYCLFALFAEVLWLFYFAEAFVAMQLPTAIAEFGQTAGEVLDRLVDTSVVSHGQAVVSLTSRLVTGGVAVAAVLGGLRRLVAGYRDGPAMILTVAPLPVVAATAYGGEIAFRLYFFALPFFAFFAAKLFFPSPDRGGSAFMRCLAATFCLLLTIGFVLANTGKDRQYRFTQDEVAAAEWVYSAAPPGSLLIEGARSYPSQFMNYENFSYLPISEEADESRKEIQSYPVEVLGRWLDDPQWTAGYVIITRSQKAYVDDMGIMPKGALDRIEQALLASPRFNLVHATPDASVFSLNPSTRNMGSWTHRAAGN